MNASNNFILNGSVTVNSKNEETTHETSHLKKSISNSNNVASIKSPTITKQIHILNNNHIFSSLGFNVIGGYLTDIPATIVDVDFNASNAKLIKVNLISNQLNEMIIFIYFVLIIILIL